MRFAGNPRRSSSQERPEKRRGDDGRDDEGGSGVRDAEERDEHDEDEADSLGHVPAHRVERTVDERRAVVVRDDHDARGQAPLV